MAYKGTSVVDYLKSVGQTSDYASRKKLAQQQGISNYTGTASQNTKMLGKIRTPQPGAKKGKDTQYRPVPDSSGYRQLPPADFSAGHKDSTPPISGESRPTTGPSSYEGISFKEYGAGGWKNMPIEERRIWEEKSGYTSWRQRPENVARISESGVQGKMIETLDKTAVSSKLTEGSFYKTEGAPDVYQYINGEYKPIKDEEAYRKVTGAKEGTPTDWGQVQTVGEIPKGQVGSIITGDASIDKPMKMTDVTPEGMEAIYKQFLGEDYEPGINEDGTPQTWESIAQHHLRAGTSETELRDWLSNPDTIAQAQKEIDDKKPFVSDIFVGDDGKLYYKTEDGEIRHIDNPEEQKELQDKGLLTDQEHYLTEDEKILVTSINDIKGKSADEIQVADLIKAGFSAEDSAKIIASFTEQLPSWSKKTEEIESEYKAEREKAEKAINDAETNLIANLEKNSNLVNTFNSFYISAGLNTIKNDIDGIDNQIDVKTKQRDNEVLDLRGQVIPQWMITGDKALAISRYNKEIDQLTIQRNNQVDDYNRQWNEIVVKTGLQEKDTKADAENLAGLVDVYTGKSDRFDEKLAEALAKGGVKFEEEKDKILNEIKAGMAPTLASIATQAAQAKLNGSSTVFGTESVGYYRFNPKTGELENVIPGVGREADTGPQLTASQQAEANMRSFLASPFAKGLTDEELRQEISAAGLNPEDFGYGKEQKYFEKKHEDIMKWNDLYSKYKDNFRDIKEKDGITIIEVKKDFTDNGVIYKRGEKFEYSS